MADKTWIPGEVPTAADFNTYLTHTGDGWNTYTPTLTQSGGVSKTVTRATYFRAGRLVMVHVFLTASGAGTSSNAVTVSLPVTAAHSTGPVGTGYIYNASAPGYFPGIAVLQSTTTIAFLNAASGGGAGTPLGASSFTEALASGDVVTFTIAYEAAS